jgi:nucleoside triphosphate diphosphatase
MTEHNITPIERLLRIMARLRDPVTGCEWDCKQDFATIAPYTIEEAYEVADAIAREDLTALKSELGDLLLQVVFHARMAEEAGHFGFDGVAEAICDKLEARHPHLFGGKHAQEESQRERWEALKEEERTASGATSAMDDVPLALPALMRAEKLQKRAARKKFDWPDAQGPLAKLQEELGELAGAASDEERMDEAGDVLFAAVNLLRKYGIAPEDALRAANRKFERRFRLMEQLAGQDGKELRALSLEAQEEYWKAAKASER